MKFPRSLCALAALAAATLFTLPAKAIDVDAGDYTALPPGTNLLLGYYQHATRDKLYANGDKVGINPKLDSDVGILRGVHFTEIGGLIVDPQFLLPFGKLRAKDDIAALGSNSGLADLILAATVWFNKADAKEHFGITPFLILPTGQYDNNDPLSLGENRWRFILQAGWIKPLTDKLTMDLVADVQFHGKNNDYGALSQERKQKPQYEFQGFLRYALGAGSDLRFGLQHVTGGENEIDGVDQDDRQSLTKLQLGASTFISPTQQILATYGRDLSVRNGFKEEHRLNLRFLQIF
ncbi:MAG TPA: transporter [Kiloniellales bacterium]|nr:transporter [Kiloniellales bacterium]